MAVNLRAPLLGSLVGCNARQQCVDLHLLAWNRGQIGDGTLELHRLIARGPGGWWAHLGDNQAAPHVGLVHAAQIVGIADVPARAPGAVDSMRSAMRFARAALNVARRRARRP